jgi:hypothetical protein
LIDWETGSCKSNGNRWIGKGFNFQCFSNVKSFSFGHPWTWKLEVFEILFQLATLQDSSESSKFQTSTSRYQRSRISKTIQCKSNNNHFDEISTSGLNEFHFLKQLTFNLKEIVFAALSLVDINSTTDERSSSTNIFLQDFNPRFSPRIHCFLKVGF